MTAAGTDPLRVVQRSPEAVAAHDREGWVALFAAGAIVNDPVGSRPHVGRTALERFYDTFIGPNTIRFRVQHDVVCGSTVVRDLTIDTTMSTGLTLSVPMHLRYDLVTEGDALRIAYLGAYWELGAMIRQMLGHRLRGLRTSLALGPQLLSNQGIGGTLGFLRGLRTTGRKGKRTVGGFLDAVASGREALAERTLAPGAALDVGEARNLPLAAFVNAMGGVRWHKLIAAGDAVTASLDLHGRPAVALHEYDRRTGLIRRVRVFV